MDEDSQTIEALDRILEMSQDIESLIEDLDRSMESYTMLGASDIAMVRARSGLRDAASATEQIALSILDAARRDGRMIA